MLLVVQKDFLWRKKNIGRVNPGRGGLDKKNSRVEIVLGCCSYLSAKDFLVKKYLVGITLGGKYMG